MDPAFKSHFLQGLLGYMSIWPNILGGISAKLSREVVYFISGACVHASERFVC